VTAVPTNGARFSQWNGSLVSSQNPLRFEMQPGLTLRAIFVTNRFQAMRSPYAGIFHGADGIHSDQAGAFSATLQDSGAFSARFEIGSVRVPITGQFNPDGSATVTIQHRQLGLVVFQLFLDPTSPFPFSGLMTTPTWTAHIWGVRPAKTFPRRYTWISEVDGTNPEAPAGESFGTLQVAASGRVALVGYLADGTPVSHATLLTSDGRLPICLPRAGRNGSVLGWAGFSSDGRRFAGLFTWTKSPGTTTATNNIALTSLGYRVEAPVVGAIYSPTNRLPGNAQLRVTCSHGGLNEPLSYSVAADRPTTSTNLPRGTITIQIARSSGLFSGTFVVPSSPSPSPLPSASAAPIARKFKGALLWERRSGAGFFPASDGATDGRVEIDF
jgi:hypothetical protein